MFHPKCYVLHSPVETARGFALHMDQQQLEIADVRITLKSGDITAESTDAIVNAANKTLLGGGGVDGAIHKAGGPDILAECHVIRRDIFPNGLPTGEAVITTAGNLSALKVIHTVGPVFGRENGNEQQLLASCYRSCLSLADAHDLTSISIPSISTGAFGFPKHLAAKVSSAAIGSCVKSSTNVKQINLVFFSESDMRLYMRHADFN